MSFDFWSAIIGAILGALIGWFVSWQIIKSSEYHKACARFRSTFVDTVFSLESLETTDLNNFNKIVSIIQAGLLEQEKARILFEPYISKRRRKKIG